MAKKVTGGIVAVAVVGLAGFFVAAGLNGQPSPLPASSASLTESPDVTEDPEPTDESHQDNDGLLQAVAERLTDPDLVWTRTNTGTSDVEGELVIDQVRVTTTADGSRLRMTEYWDGLAHTDRLVVEADGLVTVTYVAVQSQEYTIDIADRNFFIMGFGALPPTVSATTELAALRELLLIGAEAGLSGTPDQIDGLPVLLYSYDADHLPWLYQQTTAQGAELWVDPATQLPVRLDMTHSYQASPFVDDDGLSRLIWDTQPTGEAVGCLSIDNLCSMPGADPLTCEPSEGCAFFTTATFEWAELPQTTAFDFEIPAGFTELPYDPYASYVEVDLDNVELEAPLSNCWTVQLPGKDKTGETVTATVLCDALRQRGR